MIKPVKKNVVLSLEQRKETESGILLTAATYDDISEVAKVVSWGPEVSLPLKEGQEVFIMTYGWSRLKVDKNKEKQKVYLIGHEDNILAIL